LDCADLERILADGFPGWAGGLKVSGPVYRGPYSEIFRVEAAHLSSPLASKCCCRPGGCPDPTFARRQFDELTRVHQAMEAMEALAATAARGANGAGGRYRVPRPFGVLEEQAVVLMEWAAGETLARQLARQSRPMREAAASVARAGAWLRRFHDSGPRSMGPLDARELYGRLEEQIRSHGAAAARPFVRYALRALERAIPQVERIYVQRSWLHGDFQVTNVVLSREAVFGLDVSYSGEGAVLYDLACFLNAFENFLLLPKGLHLAPFRRQLVDRFLRGYAAGGPGVDPLALAWVRGGELIRFFLHFEDRGKSRFHDWYFARAVHLLVRRLAREQSRLLAGG
jgi:aminoglycoside phosphotransferase (APT) family kinase protein